MTKNKLIAECCDRVGEVYAAPAETVAAQLTNEQAADRIATLFNGGFAGSGYYEEALRMAEAALRAQVEPVAWLLRGKVNSCVRGLALEAPSPETLQIAEIDGEEWLPLYTHPKGEEHGG